MANPNFCASGTITGILVKIDVLKSKKGKDYINFELKVGECNLRMQTFDVEIVKALRGYLPGDEIGAWIQAASSKDEATGKVYTNITMRKLYTDGRETQDVLYVKGIVTGEGDAFSKDGSKKIGTYIDVNTTSKDEYPSWLRVPLAFGTKTELIKKGDTIEVVLVPDKFGFVLVGEVQIARKGGNGGAIGKIEGSVRLPAPERKKAEPKPDAAASASDDANEPEW